MRMKDRMVTYDYYQSVKIRDEMEGQTIDHSGNGG